MTNASLDPEDYQRTGFWALVGIETVEAAGGRARCRIRLGPQHLNYNGVAHGGVISSLVDSAAGSAVRSLRPAGEVAARPHATSDLHVTYLAGEMGSDLIAEARILRMGCSAIFADVDVFDDQQRLLARGLVTFIITARR